MMISLPVAVGAWFTSKSLIGLILGPEFLPEFLVFNLLFTGIVGQGVIIILGFHLLLFFKKAALQNGFMLGSIGLATILAVMGASHYGLSGIAMGSLAGRLIGAFVLLILARKYIDSIWYRDWFKILIAAGAMGGALGVVGSTNLFIKLGVGISVYGVIMAGFFKDKFRHYIQVARGS
jgi:hypothetical protein